MESIRQSALEDEMQKIAFSEDTKKGARIGANVGFVAGALPGAAAGLSLGAWINAVRNIKESGGRFGIMSHLTPKMKRKLTQVSKKNKWTNLANMAILTGLGAASTGVPSAIAGGGIGAGIGSIKHHLTKSAKLEDVGPTAAQYGISGAAIGAGAGAASEILRKVTGKPRMGNYSGLWSQIRNQYPKASAEKIKSIAERTLTTKGIVNPAIAMMLLAGGVGAGAGLFKRDNK
jgi:hypothetical protein